RGTNEMFIASIEDAFIKYTRRMVVLEDGDIFTVRQSGYEGTHREELLAEESIESCPAILGEVMRQEILEQPGAVLRALNHGGRLDFKNGTAKLGGLDRRSEELFQLEHLRTVACGTARYAADYGVKLLERYGGFQTVTSLVASEASPKYFPQKTGVLAVSQSGETMDTLDVIKRSKRGGHRVLSIVNRVGKSIARETDLGIYTNTGPEKAVASTKVFTAQSVVFALITLWFGRARGVIEPKAGRDICRALIQLPDLISEVFLHEDEVIEIARVMQNAEHAFYIGKGEASPIAYEGALKISEVAYIHAQAITAGELKHGPIALITDGFPVVAVIPNDKNLIHTVGCLREVKARGATTIVITEQDADIPDEASDYLFRVPSSHSWLTPILLNIPLQLLAYHTAKLKGLNPDRPRNLAKSVTVK
ncbi:MAG: SIS domain-containing protein, partial [bacterium]|nr:SIS domain-containing protein [bacterium]